VEGLPAVHARLKRVAIVGPKPALDVIREQDGPDTLFYLDPPYPHETRAAREVYGDFEMNEDEHRELFVVLRGVRGKVLISSYPCALYDALCADGWTRHEFEAPNHSAGGKRKRRMTEVLWCNF
jgi:DNA adenine methylase